MEAEVDFGEVTVPLRGEQVVFFLFCLRMSFSARAVHRVFASGGQEAFFEGHEHATALEPARAAGGFRPVHDAWWSAARRAHGDRHGTRALIEVLLLYRHLSQDHVVAGLAAAPQAGAVTAEAVALEARRSAETDHPEPPAAPGDSARLARVASLTERRLTRLAADSRPLPDVAVYDDLLPSRRRPRRRRGRTVTTKRHRGLTDRTAADAAIDQAKMRVERYRFRGAQISTPYNVDEVHPDGARFRRTSHDDMAFADRSANTSPDPSRITWTAGCSANGHVRFGGRRRKPDTRKGARRPSPTQPMELDRHGAGLLFQVPIEREEKASVATTSTESFAG
ncbi:hypothetical protein GCM10010178_79910 [Lentzea flava]|uniref:Transposase n=1 Tax=Lentzea flava TaxID=103732 RepID=A0ABQ2VAX1_9PSEU|nr:hypothetical protein GCM10010178_79910 [Lentzea flava]